MGFGVVYLGQVDRASRRFHSPRGNPVTGDWYPRRVFSSGSGRCHPRGQTTESLKSGRCPTATSVLPNCALSVPVGELFHTLGGRKYIKKAGSPFGSPLL